MSEIPPVIDFQSLFLKPDEHVSLDMSFHSLVIIPGP